MERAGGRFCLKFTHFLKVRKRSILGLLAWAVADFDLVDERLLTFDRGRATQKAAFFGELFIADARADPQGTLFRDFRTDREGRRKGIVVIDLKDLP